MPGQYLNLSTRERTVPDANGIAIPAALKQIAITDNIIGTVATDEVNGGAIRFDLHWIGLSPDAAVTPA